MARSITPPQRPSQTPEQKRSAIRRLEECIADLEAFDPSTLAQRDGNPQVTDIETGIDAALTAAFGFNTPDDHRYRPAATLDHGPRTLSLSPTWGRGGGGSGLQPSEFQRFHREGKEQSLILLKRAIKQLNAEIADVAPVMSARASTAPAKGEGKVFVVHGHDEAALQELARFLEKLGLHAVVLREQPDQGRTVIEKFEACADEVEFAVVLLTPDDIGGMAAAEDHSARARQNVVFELGYFAGKMGRGRVCLLCKGSVEMPSDLYGVIDTSLDDGGGWKLRLGKEMRAAGMAFDPNRLLD
jgi:predicted nucleotide-binding protein